MTPMVRIAALTNYLEKARHLGLNPQQPLTRVGLSLPMLEYPEQHVAITQVVSLLEKSASGCYSTIKGIEVMHALCRGQTSPFSYGNPLEEMSGKQSL